MREQIYFLIECGTILEWSEVFSNIGLTTSGELKLEDRFSKSIDLYHNLPFSAIQYAGPYLFTVNDMMALKGNYNWTAVRDNCDDLILDGHGNVVYLSDLTGARRQEH